MLSEGGCMKRYTFLLILFMTLFISADLKAATCSHGIFNSGTGSENDPWRITTAIQFEHIKDHSSDHYLQMNDLDFSTINHVPFDFYGVYNGQGYYIDKLTLSNPGVKIDTYFCLLSHNYGTLKNLRMKNLILQSGGYIYVFGAFVGSNMSNGVIENCINETSFDKVSASYSSIAHINHGLVKDCINKGNLTNITAFSSLSMISVNYGRVEGCINYGDYSAYTNISSYGVGGIVGRQLNGASVKLCVNYGDLTTTGIYVAGIVSVNDNSTSSIDQCSNFGTITAKGSSSIASGISGGANKSNLISITNSFNAGKIQGNTRAYGITSTSAVIKNCYNVGTLANSTEGKQYPISLNGTATNSYYLNTSATSNDSGFGSPKTSLDMSSLAFLHVLNEGKLSGKWCMGDSNYIYPNFLIEIPISISTSYEHIGDNTPATLTIKYDTSKNLSSYKLKVLNGNVEILSTGVSNLINIPIAGEGTLNITCQILDAYNSTWGVSNAISVSKKDVLNKILVEGTNKTGMQKVFILSDVNRYYENNNINQTLIKELKNKVGGIYLISNEISEVLKPLLS